MRWPFVSRAAYDQRNRIIEQMSQEAIDAARRYDDSVQFLQRYSSDLLARYDALLDKYHALKLSGASEPQPLPERPRREPDPCVQAINEKCQGNAALRMQMLAQLKRDRAAGVDDTDILAGIETGVPTFLDGVPA